MRPAASEQLSHGEKEGIFLQEKKDFCFHDTASAVIVLCGQASGNLST